MSVKIYDSTIGAFKDAQTPLIWDVQNQAWKDSTGLVWNGNAQAWEDVWGMITAYVYGAAKETITIKQNGITVCQVSTDSTGQSTEQIRLAGGTYELTGSVSGWTETQTVDCDTKRFRAMPEHSLYWYGNECKDVTGGWEIYKQKNAIVNLERGSNYLKWVNVTRGNSFCMGAICSTEKVDYTECYKLNTSIAEGDGTNSHYGITVGVWEVKDADATPLVKETTTDRSAIVTIDISKINDVGYFLIYDGPYNSWAKIDKIWME